MTEGLQGSVIAITGAGKGLGREYALHIAGLGASVVVNNRRHGGEDASSADRTVAEIVARGGKAVAEYSSVEEPQAGTRILSSALESFGRLDGLIANAGIMEGVPFHKQTPEQFREIIDINLFGTFNVVHAAFRHMYEMKSGHIVVSTSSAGLFGDFGLPAYSTSKAAVIGLMYSLSKEGARKGVHVNAIAPYAATQMTEDHLSAELRRRMDASAVAPVAAWLVSGHCAANGRIFISGGGSVACARMKTTASVPLPAIDSEAWHKLEVAPMDLAFDGAMQHFEEFVTGLAPEAGD